jgi:hypothetical protein
MAQINNVWRPAQRLYSARRSRVLLARPGRRLFMARTLRSHDRGRHEHAVIIRGCLRARIYHPCLEFEVLKKDSPISPVVRLWRRPPHPTRHPSATSVLAASSSRLGVLPSIANAEL